MRGFLATIIAVLYLNRKTCYIIQEPCRKGKVRNLMCRMMVTLMTMSTRYSIIKYMSLVYISLIGYITPVVVVFMSYLTIGEQFKCLDLFLLLISFVGVCLIGIGFHDKHFKEHKDDEKADLANEAPPLWALIGCLLLPLMSSTSRILLRTMNKMHENTTSLYNNPMIAIVMFIVMTWQGHSLSYYCELKYFDYILFLFVSSNQVFNQVIKFLSMKYDEPGKVAHWDYFSSIY